MKKTQLTWLMAFMMLVFANFGFTSCGDDDDDDDATSLSESILGTWKYSSAEITIAGQTYSPEDLGYELDEASVTFNSDKTYESNGVKQGTWSLDGNKLTITITAEPDESETATISISGNTLTLTTEETEDGVTASMTMTFTK